MIYQQSSQCQPHLADTFFANLFLPKATHNQRCERHQIHVFTRLDIQALAALLANVRNEVLPFIDFDSNPLVDQSIERVYLANSAITAYSTYGSLYLRRIVTDSVVRASIDYFKKGLNVFQGVQFFIDYFNSVITIEADFVVELELLLEELMSGFEEKWHDWEFHFVNVLDYGLQELLEEVSLTKFVEDDVSYHLLNHPIDIFIIHIC